MGWRYFPSVPELMVTIGLVSLHILLFIQFCKLLLLRRVSEIRIISGGLVELVGPGVNDRIVVEVVNGGKIISIARRDWAMISQQL